MRRATAVVKHRGELARLWGARVVDATGASVSKGTLRRVPETTARLPLRVTSGVFYP